MQIIKVRGRLTPKQLNKIVSSLKNGGLVVYPTETCYGIGALCTSSVGVGRLIAYKRRPEGKAVSVAVVARNMALKYVELNSIAENIYTNFLPGPFTVISKSRGVVDKRLVSELGTLGIRIPNHPIPLQIIDALDEGITSTSANVSGGKTPYKVQDLLSNISEKRTKMIDIVIDYGELPKNPPSVVVDTTQSSPQILRGDDKVGLLSNPAVQTTKLAEWETSSDQATIDLAPEIWSVLSKERLKPLVLLLSGELGAGKTHLVKGLAKTIGVKDNILSPTFVFERQYVTTDKEYSKLYHYDLWRLEGGEQVMQTEEVIESLGIEEALKHRAFVAIEWPENVAEIDKYLLEKAGVLYRMEIDYNGVEKRKFSLYKLTNE